MIIVHKELKKEILNWLLNNENRWQRTNACTEQFRNYVYDDNGEYLIGGRNVVDFIYSAEELIYG